MNIHLDYFYLKVFLLQLTVDHVPLMSMGYLMLTVDLLMIGLLMDTPGHLCTNNFFQG